MLQQGFTVFADEKDSLLSLTPLYLMCGLSFPLWMPTSNLPLLVLLSGVLTVGIGDTAASFVGGKWGSHKWHDTEKTVEGTVACILCQICIILGLTFSGRFHLPDIFFFLCFYQQLICLFSRILYLTRFCERLLVVAEKHSGGCGDLGDRRTHKSSGQSSPAVVNVRVSNDLNERLILFVLIPSWWLCHFDS